MARIGDRSGAFGVLVLLMPGGLDGFENALVRLRGIAFECRQLHHPLMQIGKAHRVGIGVREHLLQLNADLFGVGPVQVSGHEGLLWRSLALVSVYGRRRAVCGRMMSKACGKACCWAARLFLLDGQRKSPERIALRGQTGAASVAALAREVRRTASRRTATDAQCTDCFRWCWTWCRTC